MKKIKKIAKIFALCLTIFLLLFFSVAYYLGSQAKDLLMVEINKQLVVKGHLQKLSVDPFSSFPFINIQLQNLRIEESTQHFQKDLFGLESLQLTFHPVKIFRGKWEVEKIRISNGQIRIFKGAKNNNFQIIRPHKKNTSNDQNPFWRGPGRRNRPVYPPDLLLFLPINCS